MPAQSRAQQRAAGAALSAKRGETAPSELQGAARSMFDSMTEAQLEDLAATRLDGLPEHVEEERPD
jgi:2-methylcitrate dehydratase PrpD